jgi:hypothetical protein
MLVLGRCLFWLRFRLTCQGLVKVIPEQAASVFIFVKKDSGPVTSALITPLPGDTDFPFPPWPDGLSLNPQFNAAQHFS